MSKKYRDAVEAFFRDQCGPFAGVDPKAEQLLEYTEVYQQYVGLVEQQLEDFTRKHGVTSEELFREVQEVMGSGDLDDEFLPAILRVAEYSYFMEQMVLNADHRAHLREAFDQAANGFGSGGKSAEPGDEALDSVTGVWRVDKRRTNFDGLDNYLAAIRVPVVFRGLAKGTYFSNKELVVLQQPSSIALVANSPFGMQRLDYLLDDQVHEVANPWGVEVPVRAALDVRGHDGVEVVVELSKPKHLPPGSSVVHTWCGVDKGRALRCAMEVQAAGRSPVRFDLFYSPVASEAELAPRRKGPGGAASPKLEVRGRAAGAKGEGPVAEAK